LLFVGQRLVISVRRSEQSAWSVRVFFGARPIRQMLRMDREPAAVVKRALLKMKTAQRRSINRTACADIVPTAVFKRRPRMATDAAGDAFKGGSPLSDRFRVESALRLGRGNGFDVRDEIAQLLLTRLVLEQPCQRFFDMDFQRRIFAAPTVRGGVRDAMQRL